MLRSGFRRDFSGNRNCQRRELEQAVKGKISFQPRRRALWLQLRVTDRMTWRGSGCARRGIVALHPQVLDVGPAKVENCVVATFV